MNLFYCFLRKNNSPFATKKKMTNTRIIKAPEGTFNK